MSAAAMLPAMKSVNSPMEHFLPVPFIGFYPVATGFKDVR